MLNLGDGVAPQAAWAFKSVNMKDGSRLIGAPGATVNVNGAFNTSGGNIITNIDLNVAAVTSAEIVQIFNNSILTKENINAPFGKCHVHTGTDLAECSEVCCKVLDVEPITAECGVNPLVCVCPTPTARLRTTFRGSACATRASMRGLITTACPTNLARRRIT